MKLMLCWVVNRFIDTVGGTERVVCGMANEFARRGWSVLLVFNDPKQGVPFYPLRPEVELINLNGTGRDPVTIPKWVKVGRELTRPFCQWGLSYFFERIDRIRKNVILDKLNDTIAEAAPDLILPFFTEDLMVLTDSPAAKRIPIVQTLRNPPNIAIGPLYPAKRRALEQCARVHVLLESFRSGVQKQCDVPIVVIPNGVTQYTEQISYNKKNAYRILNLARLEPRQKQQHILIDAFALLADEFPSWTLHFYGAATSDRYRLKLERQIRRHGLSDRIFLEGVTHKVNETLLTGDIFGFPSSREGISNALLEAMCAGLPSVGFRAAPSVNELIRDGENGLLAEPGAKSLAAALRRLMSDAPLRRRLGENARRFASQFEPEKVWDQWENLLKEVIAEKKKKNA